MKYIISFLSLLFATAASAQDVKTYSQTVQGAITFKMIGVPAGKFLIGSPQTDKKRDTDEGPQKEIEVSPFWMGEKEITFAEWDCYFKDNSLPQSKNIDGVTRATPQYIDLTWGMGRDATHPVNSMSQTAALMYCKWLHSKTGLFFRLPTEAEWEYACNAGTNNKSITHLKESAYFIENSENKFHHVGEKKPNPWGFYDMLGNLSEWTLDQYQPDLSRLTNKDPLNLPASKYPRTVKGGSFLDGAKELRCSNRIASDASWNKRDPQIPKSKWWLTDGMFVGFRVVRPLQQPSKEEIERFFALYLK